MPIAFSRQKWFKILMLSGWSIFYIVVVWFAVSMAGLSPLCKYRVILPLYMSDPLTHLFLSAMAALYIGGIYFYLPSRTVEPLRVIFGKTLAPIALLGLIQVTTYLSIVLYAWFQRH